MKNHNPYISHLFQKYLEGSYSEEDLDTLLAYFKLDEDSEQLRELIEQQFARPIPEAVNQKEVESRVIRIGAELEQKINPPVKIKRYKWWYAVASIFLISTIATISYLYIKDTQNNITLTSAYGGDVEPATNKATITLSDGSKYELSDDQKGITIGEAGIAYSDGKLIAPTDKVTTAVIDVPRGGIYNMTLPDGTKVYLNSATTLHYPVRFNGAERKVELKGEGYFEVTHNPDQPFIVSTGVQELKVLGTQFNVQAYRNEKTTSTLIQGSVELHTGSSNVKLSPGYQAVLENEKFAVNAVNPEEYTAWIDKQFVFNNMPLKEAFAEIERWYDVQFEYPQDVFNQNIYAGITRDRKLSEVLAALEEIVNLKFTIEGRRVLVRK